MTTLMGATDFTAEATELFSRFAVRHGLAYVVVQAPVDVMWRFPVQGVLAQPIVLALQNIDELSFAVGDFWSSFYPYPEKCAQFERLIDDWIARRARIVKIPGLIKQTLELQVLNGGSWCTIYRVRSFGLRKVPSAIVMNSNRP